MADTLKVRIAAAMWKDPSSGKWKCYAEGSEITETYDPKQSCEDTIIDNGMNCGQSIYWRVVEADLPIPADHELTVEGVVVGD